MNIDKDEKIILWTGGWDSTFRILSTLLTQDGPNIRPLYLLDTSRASTINELETIHKIKKQIFKKGKYYSDKLKPMLIIDSSDIPEISEIREAYCKIRQTNWLGSQYVQLAELINHFKLTYPEISIEADVTGLKFLHAFLRSNVTTYNGMKILSSPMQDNISKSYCEIFKYFSFPLIFKSKLDMHQESLSFGISEELQMSWFCHTPRRGQPCGLCGPCQDIVKADMAWRLPFLSRLICKTKRNLNKMKEKLNL
ncbi:hypothetical protein H206_03225 [Candidatus Electrothrix aarhusensis]|uniref:7-cyano-7-deazaguanine synthase n=1 Tax=Candidatus Electrothrix aarhusensis TaxID=1859131 RepID=A0A444IQ45_9BACT|nr:hypothetical protein H206_03225 [Candidatus Electrothrix aarhusensis]